MSAIEKALLDATGVKPQKTGEHRQKYLVRLMMGVQKLPEEKWEALAEVDGAQDWYNAATEADNAEEELPNFSDAEEEEEEEQASGEESAEETEGSEEHADEGSSEEEEEVEEQATGKAGKPAKAGKAGKAAKAAKPEKKAKANGAAKPEKKAAAKPEKKAASGKKPSSMRRVLKTIVVKKPKISVDDLMAQLENKGFKSPSRLTVTSIRSDTRDTMRALVDAGMLEAEL